MFISDSGCGVVRKVDGPTQIISTIAGTAFSWGPAVSSVSFSSVKFKPDIRTVAVDSLSNLYVADSNNYVIRGLDFSQEVVYVVAGTPSVSGYSGDGVMATNAYLNIPWSVFIDSLGYAYIADTYNNRIRKVVPIAPTSTPTGSPSTYYPSAQPSSSPTQPTGQPTSSPMQPTGQPTSSPTVHPTKPTPGPTQLPSGGPSNQPTGQPTGVPTQQPTSYPTTALDATISFNVTHQLHGVKADVLVASAVCQKALGYAVTEILGLPAEEGFLYLSAVDFSNEIFDYNYVDVKVNPAGEIDGNDNFVTPGLGPWHTRHKTENRLEAGADTFNFAESPNIGLGRKLGETAGNWGVTVSYTIYASPTHFAMSDTDELYATLKAHLIKSVRRGYMTSVIISMGRRRGCSSLQTVSGTDLVFISSDYLSTVTHSAPPTSMPSSVIVSHPRRNFNGIIAGTIVGITAFIMFVMWRAQRDAEAESEYFDEDEGL
jgi:hypothetical protein